jgi:hypothetical protein
VRILNIRGGIAIKFKAFLTTIFFCHCINARSFRQKKEPLSNSILIQRYLTSSI